MNILEQYLAIWKTTIPVDFLRYLLAALPAFAILYIWRRNPFRHRRIFRDQRQSKVQFFAEFARSLRTALIFSMVGAGVGLARSHGFTRIYLHVGDYGWLYLLGSVGAAILLHDAYFYWTHRMLHLPFFFRRYHRAHHRSLQPSPLAAYSFSVVEALVQAGIFPLVLFLIPMHPLAILSWMIFMILKNVIGHSGFELYPAGWLNHRWSAWNTTVTHHELHHRHTRGNFGLYFTWWDEWMGTARSDYAERFAKACSVPARPAVADSESRQGGAL